MAAEQFVINIITTGDKEAVAAQGRVAASSREMGAAAKGASTASAAAATTTAQKWSNAGTTAAAAGKKLNRGLTLPILAIGAVTGKMAVDFEKSMRNVNSIAQLPEAQFQKLNDTVLHMAGKVAQAPVTLSEGLYDLVSSGFDANESITILNASARAATAGLTTTEVSTKAVAAALNAYHRPASDAKAISDDLFQTVNRGVITFDELASTIGYVLPAASTMGVDLKQVGASISTLTKEGQSGANAVTNINAALTAFIKPSKDMKSVLTELGYETSKQLISQKGFQGALELVTKAVGGGEEAIGKLFPNVRAMRAVFGLTGSSAKSAGEDVRGFQNDTGATAKVLHEQQKSISYQWNQLKAEASELGIEVGTKLIPVMHTLAGDLMGVVHWFTNLPEGVQTTTLKMLALGAALGPILTIGGNLMRVIGGVSTAIKGLAAANIVGELGSALSMSGERGAALKMVGGDMAGTLIGGLTKVLPVAAAAAGIGNIIYSATQGDMKEAGFKAGGALVGGIAGAFLGPEGAMIGAGAGSFLGGLVGKLFDDSGQSAFQKRNEQTVKAAIAGHRRLISSSKQVAQTERRLHNIGDEQAGVNRRLKATQDRLNTARKNGDTGRVRHEEAALNELKAKQILLTHRQWHEETLLHAAHVKSEADARRARKVEIALILTRETQLEQARKRETVARKAFETAVLQNKPLKEQNEKERELIAAQKRRKGASEKLTASEKELGGTMKEIANKFGDAFAEKLRKQLPIWHQTIAQQKESATAMRELAPAIVPLQKRIEQFGKHSAEATHRVRDSAKELSQKAPGFLGHTAKSYTNMATTGTEGLSVLGGNTNSFLKTLNAKPLSFNVVQVGSGKGHARGGITRVQGRGLRDTVPLTGSGINAVVAPGEDVIVANRHQRPELDYAVQQTFGDRGLNGFFSRSKKPHNFAQGGVAKDASPAAATGQQAAMEVLRKVGIKGFPEIKISGPAPLATGAQGGVDVVFAAAAEYLKKHAGSPKVRKMIKFAEEQAAKNMPYVFGGGHASFAGPYDCSGYVSAILHAGGFLSTPLAVAQGSGLYTFGQAGQGQQVTWGVRGTSGANAHTMISLKDVQAGWKYFESGGSGGGAHEDSGWDGSFSFRHPEGFARGGTIARGRDRDKMPKAARRALARYGADAADPRSPHFVGWGYNRGGIPTRHASGGWVKTGYTIYTGSGAGAGGNLQSGTPGYAELGTATSSGQATGTGYIAQALGMSGELPFGYALDVKIGGKSATLEKKDRGYGQGTSAYSIDIHQRAWSELGLSEANGKGTAFIKPGSGSAAGGKSESVPAVFNGARTKSINFPSVPKTLHGVNKEIGKWTAQLKVYKRAEKQAHAKPKTAAAIKHNITAIEGYLRQLYRQRSILRRKAAQKKIQKKLQRKLGKITGVERKMEEAERAFNIANQTAGQWVSSEPQQPEGEGGEAQYVKDFTAFVEQHERPAYQTVLDRLADWRNITLGGEETASRLETGWEKEVREIVGDIHGINAFSQKVGDDKATWRKAHKTGAFPKWIKDEIKKDHQERSRLPMLRFRDNEVRKVLGEAREAFYGGRKDPITPPAVPMAGSGNIEGVLEGIQGTHWPDQHGRASSSALAPPKQPGIGGGELWTVQEAIEELGLKIKQAGNIGGGGGGGNSLVEERNTLLEQQNAELLREKAVHAAQAPVLASFLGSYGKGGTLPSDGYYYGHAGERLTPRDQTGDDGDMMVLEPHVHLHGSLSALEGSIDARVELRQRKTGRTVGLRRGTPSVAGRRAAMTQGGR